MSTKKKQQKTRQEKPKPWGVMHTESGELILDTRTGYRNEELCAIVNRRALELGLWGVETEAGE